MHRINGLWLGYGGKPLFGGWCFPWYGAFLFGGEVPPAGGYGGEKKVLEIGCGTGSPLCYMGSGAFLNSGAWTSPGAAGKGKENLAARGMKARLVCAPMEEECGLPEAYFDLVYSIYAIG